MSHEDGKLMANEDKKDIFNEIMLDFDEAWTTGEEARNDAANDIFFSRVSHWDDWLEQFTTLQYRGQFDLVRPVVRKIVAEMRQNPISVRFKPKDGAPPNAGDVLTGLYRTDMNNIYSKCAVDIAAAEQIICGDGAWRLCTEYADQNPTSNNQVIKRKPIHEAYNHVVWDANAKQIDKSDANHVTIITPLSQRGWVKFAEKEGLDDKELPSFHNPEFQWYFPWLHKDVIYIGEHYRKITKKEKVFIYLDPNTQELVSYFKKDIQDVIEEIADKGFEKVGERMVERCRIYKYLVTGDRILKGPDRIAGEHLPVVCAKGDWGFAGDKETSEGIVRGMKDIQRARNMVMSFNMDIIGKSPRRKPFFYPEQIEGYEWMYTSQDDYPFYYINRKAKGAAHTADLPAGPIGYLEDATISDGSKYIYEATTQAIKDFASNGADENAVNGNPGAFDTVNQINQRADMETFVFMDNLATAMRRDGEIYASMAAEIYDSPRSITLTDEDGTEKEVTLYETMFDLKTGKSTVLNDLAHKFDTYVDTGPSFNSMKDQNKAELQELITSLDVTDPTMLALKQILVFSYIQLLDGKGVEVARDYASKQMLLMGLREPDNEQEEQLVQQQAQAKAQQSQNDPNILLAQAEMVNAQAQQIKAQSQAQSDQVKMQNQTIETQLKAYTAQQEQQRTQAEVVLKLAQAQGYSDKAVTDAIRLLNEASKANEASTNIPGGRVPTGANSSPM